MDSPRQGTDGVAGRAESVPRAAAWGVRGGRGVLHWQRDTTPMPPPLPPCDIPLVRGFFTGPWIVTRSSLRMLRRVTAF